MGTVETYGSILVDDDAIVAGGNLEIWFGVGKIILSLSVIWSSYLCIGCK